MMGDRSKLLTHYHDDARTLYEVFQRGLHISGGYGVRSSLTHTHTFSATSVHAASSIRPKMVSFFIS